MQNASAIRNKSIKTYRLLNGVGRSISKRTIKNIFIKVKLIKIFYKRIQNPLENIINIKQIKSYADGINMFKRNVKKNKAPENLIEFCERKYNGYSMDLLDRIMKAKDANIQPSEAIMQSKTVNMQSKDPNEEIMKPIEITMQSIEAKINVQNWKRIYRKFALAFTKKSARNLFLANKL